MSANNPVALAMPGLIVQRGRLSALKGGHRIKLKWTGLAASLLLAGAALAQPYGMGPGMMGGGAMFGVGHLLGWAMIVVAIVVWVRWLGNRSRGGGASGGDRALGILRERFARGEIDKAEFDARKRDPS